MTVAELINKLSQFSPDQKVMISDGYDFKFYDGEYTVVEFLDGDEMVVDIGVGGCSVD